MDGFQYQRCPFRCTSRKAIKAHGNKAHNQKRTKDDVLFQCVRLQTWFRDGKERYWVVDEGQRVIQERQAQRAAIQDVGEVESNSGSGSGSGSGSDDEADEIIQEIEQWKAEAQVRRLQALQNVPVVEIDSWLQYTGWNAVLNQSKHDIIKTAAFTHEASADIDEPALERVVQA